VHFRFAISPTDGPSSELDLGHLEITGPAGSVTSADRHLSFWVYLGIPDLVGGLTELADGRYSSYRFEPLNSSFAVTFQRKRAMIRAKACGVSLGTEPIPDVLAGLRAGIDAFVRDHPLDPTERYASELNSALAAIRSR
jgi:hypothetical protein